MNDEKLIRYLQSSDDAKQTEAFNFCIDRISKWLTYTILELNGQKEDVEDILSEALVILWKKVNRRDFDGFKKKSAIRYLCGICMNLWFKRFNMLYKDTDLGAIMVDNENDVDNLYYQLLHFPDQTKLCDEPAFWKSKYAGIFLDALSRKIQSNELELLNWRFIDGFKPREIKSLLENKGVKISIEALRTRISRLKQKIMDYYNEFNQKMP